MSATINLRQARKRKLRAEAARAAEEQRLKHGRTAAEASRSFAVGVLQNRRHEGHRRLQPESSRDEDGER